MGGCTQFRGKCFWDWTRDWEKKGQLLQKRPFPQSALRQNSRPHFDGRSSSGLHASDDERRHNGFGCRAVRPKPPGSASQGHLPFSCGCLIRACIMARAVLALLYSEYPRCERPKQKSLRKAGFLTYGLRRRLPPRNDGDRHTDLKKIFSGLDRGLGEGRGSFYKKRPSFPQLKPR